MATIKSKAALQAVKTSTHKINNADWQDFVESAVLKLSSTGYANPAMLGSGTASSVTYLRGDGVWAEVEAGTTLDVSAFIETLLDDSDAATARATLGLGTISTLDSSLFVVKTSTVADGASAVAHYLDTSTAYVTAGAKLLSLRNATVEKFSVGYDGALSIPVGAPYQMGGNNVLIYSGGVVRLSDLGGGLAFRVGSIDSLALNPLGAVTLTQTWNNALTTFKAFTIDVTDTASASGSLLMDLRTGGYSMATITKGGYLTLKGDAGANYISMGADTGNSGVAYIVAGSEIRFYVSNYSDGFVAYTPSAGVIGFKGAYNYNSGVAASFLLAGGANDTTPGNLYLRGGYSTTPSVCGVVKIQSADGLTDYVTVTNTGKVGIGTTSPSALLHVNGTSRFADYIKLTNGATPAWNISNIEQDQDVANFAFSYYDWIFYSHNGSRQAKITFVNYSNNSHQALAISGGITDYNNNNEIANQIIDTGQGRLTITGTAFTSSMTGDYSFVSVTPTWNAGLLTFTGLKVNVTDTASASASLLMDLQVGGTSKFKADKSGNVENAGYVYSAHFTAQTAGVFQWNGRSVLTSPADGVIALYNAGYTGFTRLCFGGTTSSFPALERYAYGLSVKLADNSGKGFFEANGCWLGYHANKVEAPTVGFYTDSVDNTATFLQADAAGILAQRNGTNAQAFRVYNTISGSDYDAGVVGWYANTYFVIGTPEFMGIRGGSGSARAVWVASNAAIYFSTNSDGGGNWQIGNDHVFAPMDAFDIGRTANRVAAYYGGGNTVTASAPVLNLTQTWNNGAVTFTGILADFTDTASASGSLLADFMVGGVSKTSISKAGVLTAYSVVVSNGSGVTGSNGAVGYFNTGNGVRLTSYDTMTFQGWNGSAYADQMVIQTVTGNVGIGTTNPGSYKLYVNGATLSIGALVTLDDAYVYGQGRMPYGSRWYWMNPGETAYDAFIGRSGVYQIEVPWLFVGGAGTPVATSGAVPGLRLDMTWNAGAETFTAFKVNVTDTASASGSLLMDLQVGGIPLFSVRKDGLCSSGVGFAAPSFTAYTNAVIANATYLTSFGPQLGAGVALHWADAGGLGSTSDLFLYRDAAGILAQRNGANAQTYRVYQDYTSATDYRRFSVGSAGFMGESGSAGGGAFSVEFGSGANNNGNVFIRVNDSRIWRFSGTALRPEAAYDLGETGNRIAAYYGGGNTVTASAPVINLTQTWNSGAVDFVGILADFTYTAASSASNLLELKLSGTTQFRVGYDGRIYTPYISYAKAIVASDVGAGGTSYGAVLQHATSDPYGGVKIGLTLGGTGFVAWDGSGPTAGSPDVAFYRNAAGVVEINNGTAGTYRDLIARKVLFGGATSSFPLLKRDTTWLDSDLAVRFADDSGYSRLLVGGFISVSANPGAASYNTGGGYYDWRIGNTLTELCAGMLVAWSSVASAVGVKDLGLARNAAGVIEVNDGNTPGTYRDLILRNIVGQTGYHELIEMTAPSAPAANTVRLYAEDNGAGKTRLMALFPSGAAQQVAIEP